MNSLRLFLAAAVITLAAALAGCKSDSTTEPTPPDPTPTSIAEAEPNDATPQAVGTLRDSAIVVSGTSANGSDIDKYSFALPAQRSFSASISWSGGADLNLGVANGSGILMAYRDTGGNPENCTLTAMPQGTYVLQVLQASNQSQAYRITITPR